MSKQWYVNRSRKRTKHNILVAELWALVDKLRKNCLIGEQILDPRDEIADEIANLLVAADEAPPCPTNAKTA